MNKGYSVTGIQVDLRTASAEDKLVELLNSDNSTGEVCTGPETFDYDDGLYTGTAELWTDCTEDGTALLQVVAHRAGNQYVTVEIQMLSDADIDAAIAALEGFKATELTPGESWNEGDEATTQNVGDTFDIVIRQNPSVGDAWRVLPSYDTNVVKFLYEDYETDDPMAAGSAGTSYFAFEAVATGSTTVELENCSGCDETGAGGSVTAETSMTVVVEP